MNAKVCEALPLRTQPCLELGRGAIDAIEQLTAIKGGCPVWRPRRQRGKFLRVDLDPGRLENHRFPIRLQRIEPGRSERLAQGGKRLPEAVSRLNVASVAPQ
jgi:hypothetical protein